MLKEQTLEGLDPSTLSPLSPEVISRQATINVGTVGHVAHGKSTIVRALSGVHTVKFKKEKERNITIRLGYANAKLYKLFEKDGAEVTGEEAGKPGLYTARGSATPDEFDAPCGKRVYKLQRHVSFVDCPGHDILMATMLTGAAVMDAVLLLVAANEQCPQPQTAEHLAAVEILRLKDIIIVQNKCELLRKEETIAQRAAIKEFVEGTIAQDAPILPVSAVKTYNTDVLAEYLCTRIPVPSRDFVSPPQMMIIRSFDVNKPGQEVDELRGGVAGGCILKGVLRVGDEVEIRPGAVSKTASGDFKIKPIRTRIVTMNAEENELQYAVPGGLIGVGTLMDPTLTRSDLLVGHFVGHPGAMPSVYKVLEVRYTLLRKLLGVKTDAKSGEKKSSSKVQPLKADEVLLVNIGSKSAGCIVTRTQKDQGVAELKLTAPVCVEIGDKIAISRKIDKNWRLIGWGKVGKGVQVDVA